MSVIRGAYSATYNALAVGNTEVGFRMSYSYKGRNINFDAVGEVPVDVIFAGISLTVDFVAQEYDAAAIDILRWPFNGIVGTIDPAGLSMWQQAKPLILTGCTNGVDPQTITFYKAILAPDYDLDIEFSHKERPLPIRLMVLPVKYNSEGYTTPEYPSGCSDVVYFEEANWAGP